MSRKGQSITLSVSERDKAHLEELAGEFGMTWGEKPNISKLITAIARQQLRIAPNNDWLPERIELLNRVRNLLSDRGNLPEAKEIAKILCDRGELSLPLRQEIEAFLNAPIPAWREQIETFIHRQQPFRLSYRDAADRLFHYTVLYARIIPIEKREYLLCRCQETEGNYDIKELCHNWSLLLERIQEAAVVSVNQKWKPDLEYITVELCLSGGLAFGYRSKPGDQFVGNLEGDPPTRQVIRQIYSSFWFMRDIRPYGKNCEIIAPQNLRDRYIQELLQQCQQYGISIPEEGDRP